MAVKQKEIQQELADSMRKWQKIENASIASTGKVMAETENPIIRLVMEIIQRDSAMHHRVQEWIADSLDTKAVSISPDEVAKVWDMIEEHIKIEQETISLAKSALESIEGKGMVVQNYLLNYLLQDEEKHASLLDNLGKIKAGIVDFQTVLVRRHRHRAVRVQDWRVVDEDLFDQHRYRLVAGRLGGTPDLVGRQPGAGSQNRCHPDAALAVFHQGARSRPGGGPLGREPLRSAVPPELQIDRAIALQPGFRGLAVDPQHGPP